LQGFFVSQNRDFITFFSPKYIHLSQICPFFASKRGIFGVKKLPKSEFFDKNAPKIEFFRKKDKTRRNFTSVGTFLS